MNYTEYYLETVLCHIDGNTASRYLKLSLVHTTMGGGSNRKKNDKVTIPRPSQTREKGGVGGGSGGGANQGGDSSRVCPLSFPVKLEKGLNATENTPLTLEQDGDVLVVIMNYKKVATLPKGKSQQILSCVESGYRYKGRVKLVRGEAHGFFERS